MLPVRRPQKPRAPCSTRTRTFCHARGPPAGRSSPTPTTRVPRCHWAITRSSSARNPRRRRPRPRKGGCRARCRRRSLRTRRPPRAAVRMPFPQGNATYPKDTVSGGRRHASGSCSTRARFPWPPNLTGAVCSALAPTTQPEGPSGHSHFVATSLGRASGCRPDATRSRKTEASSTSRGFSRTLFSDKRRRDTSRFTDSAVSVGAGSGLVRPTQKTGCNGRSGPARQ